MLGKIITSLGMNYRSVVLLALLLGALLAGVSIELFSYPEKINKIWYVALTPFLFVFLILMSALCLPCSRRHLRGYSHKIKKEESKKTPHKSLIAIACYGTFGALGILLACVLIFFGFQNHLPVILGCYILFGWIVVFKFMWPFFERKMKQ